MWLHLQRITSRTAHLDALTVRFRPYEASIDEFDFLQAFDTLYAECEQLFTLQLGADPLLRRHQIPAAGLAVHNHYLHTTTNERSRR
jgi:hypothetical protein